jgi:hypothetical protein
MCATVSGVSLRVPDADVLFSIIESTSFHDQNLMILALQEQG